MYRYVNTMSLEASSFDHHASLFSNICACTDTAVEVLNVITVLNVIKS